MSDEKKSGLRDLFYAIVKGIVIIFLSTVVLIVLVLIMFLFNYRHSP